MNQKEKSVKIINDLIEKHKSARDFAITIGEDSADVFRWRNGKLMVKARAVVKIARIYKVKPSELRPDIFPEDLTFVFN